MGKVSIGLRGWRFDEDEVFDSDGEFKPLTEMPQETSDRISRLMEVATDPCDACWLTEENEENCRVARIVYGEPMAEVVLCAQHEPDFLYWFREEGGVEFAGSERFPNAFYRWFSDGGRAPETYAGIEHVDTQPESLPEPNGNQYDQGEDESEREQATAKDESEDDEPEEIDEQEMQDALSTDLDDLEL